jgi:hypothetical protein
LKKFGALVIGLADVTLFASFLWWAADKIKKADAVNPEMWAREQARLAGFVRKTGLSEARFTVMPALARRQKDVDGRDKPGHDGLLLV